MRTKRNYYRIHQLRNIFNLSRECAIIVDQLCDELTHYSIYQDNEIIATLEQIMKFIPQCYDVQSLENDFYNTRYYYINRGDTYIPTIIYKCENQRVLIQAWGDLTEVKNGKCF